MILLLLGACATALHLGRADVLPVGEATGGVGLEVQLVSAKMDVAETNTVPWVQVSGAYRRGVATGVEVGGRAWFMGIPRWFSTGGVGADVKIRLHTSREPADPHLAFAPGLAWQALWFGDTPVSVAELRAPLLLGYDIRRSQLVFAPRLSAAINAGPGQRPIVGAGFGLGVAWHLPNRAGTIEWAPVFDWFWSPTNFEGVWFDPDKIGAGALQLGLSASWGAGRAPEVSPGAPPPPAPRSPPP